MMNIIYEASSILEQSQPPTGGGCAFRLKINISNKKNVKRSSQFL